MKREIEVIEKKDGSAKVHGVVELSTNELKTGCGIVVLAVGILILAILLVQRYWV